MEFNKSLLWWPILPFGGETVDEGQNDGNSNPPANAVSLNLQHGQDNSASQNQNDEEDDDPYAGLSAKELRRLLRDTETSKSTVESEKAALEKKIKEVDDAKLSKEQKLENDVSERDSIISTLRAANAKLAIINAINQDVRFEWHNPEIVAQQLNSDVVKISDDGRVEGITKELARISKEHSYLLKTKETQQNNSGQQKSNDQGPTGFQPGQGGANQGGTLSNTAELAKNYPALANRLSS